ncbi:DHA2 family efflux MFS transporter permease subunit [Sphingomonas sp. SRS2]|uniref:DHA2 family efflux MFS transporter permease subunit n=1 Tax=Sphingomonas sp. SRS2 TaxID=133190 RepID=UPI0006184E1F|nr:DHA2 family efflux MFS transporter permease subunit [Sphingomonas sp. SRS2]KKC23818.1 multidrug resistance protein B [Sphingomonas sp. SRS2]
MRTGETYELFSPRRRVMAMLALALANLTVVFDLTIANVSVPHIAGSLGITPSQGTWVITSYAVAEAICVPLTGWLAQRFGAVRTFTVCVTGFGLFSILCGLSVTLDMLVICRIGQGLCGGPIMPLSQMLIIRVYPPEKRAQATGIWAMTTMVGPALGPILGGTISDNLSWHWIFFINVPIVVLCVVTTLGVLGRAETPTEKLPIDVVGLGLLILWIGAFQIMLDIGREHDWFADPMVVGLAIVALVGLAAFVIWELTEEHPIVDLRIFRHRTFTVGVITVSMGFSAYFAGIVVIPQWLQLSLGYTATQAGLATAFTAMGGLLVARLAPILLKRYDARIILSAALIWIGGTTMLRSHWTSDADFFTLAFPQMIMGLGMPFFFITVTSMTLSAVRPNEVGSAAGLQNFTRTISIAACTSLVITFWDNQARTSGSELAGKINPDATSAALAARGIPSDQSWAMIAQLVDKQALTLATDKVFLVAGLVAWASAAFVWLMPRPPVGIEPAEGAH